MPVSDAQLERIFDELSSIQAQLRSMAASIASNNVDVGQRITSLESWKESHGAEVTEKLEYLNGGMEELSAKLGTEVAKLDLRVSPLEKAQGIATFIWKAATAIILLAGGVLGILKTFGGGKFP